MQTSKTVSTRIGSVSVPRCACMPQTKSCAQAHRGKGANEGSRKTESRSGAGFIQSRLSWPNGRARAKGSRFPVRRGKRPGSAGFRTLPGDHDAPTGSHGVPAWGSRASWFGPRPVGSRCSARPGGAHRILARRSRGSALLGARSPLLPRAGGRRALTAEDSSPWMRPPALPAHSTVCWVSRESGAQAPAPMGAGLGGDGMSGASEK